MGFFRKTTPVYVPSGIKQATSFRKGRALAATAGLGSAFLVAAWLRRQGIPDRLDRRLGQGIKGVRVPGFDWESFEEQFRRHVDDTQKR